MSSTVRIGGQTITLINPDSPLILPPNATMDDLVAAATKAVTAPTIIPPIDTDFVGATDRGLSAALSPAGIALRDIRRMEELSGKKRRIDLIEDALVAAGIYHLSADAGRDGWQAEVGWVDEAPMTPDQSHQRIGPVFSMLNYYHVCHVRFGDTAHRDVNGQMSMRVGYWPGDINPYL